MRCRRKRTRSVLLLGLPLFLVVLSAVTDRQFTTAAEKQAKARLTLHSRSRVETAAGSGLFRTVAKTLNWDPKKTAIVVCDMWDLHHCLNATRRGAEMAPRMNRVLKEARSRGVTIIHAPSRCMEFYKGHPGRKRAMTIPRALNMPQDIGSWCYVIPSEEQGKYPIDQTDGGEDDDLLEHRQWAAKLTALGRNPLKPWKRQTDLLAIEEGDFISDDGHEIWSVLELHNIQNVILAGVHTNMCVLGRPFGLRNMAKNGKNVVLMRDMTDTMYNPQRAPYVSHFTGTDLIVEHIEKWVCPSITSVDLLGGRPFRFKNDSRPHLVIVTAEREYQTDQSLPPFAVSHLGGDFKISHVFANPQDRNDLPGIEILDEADVALISVRRRVLPPQQMVVIRRFVETGKPLVGIRTASHAFSLRSKEPPSGYAAWETFDPDVIGGHYVGHHGHGQQTSLRIADGLENHPILTGVETASFVGNGSLYLSKPLGESAMPLLIGSIPGKPAEPVAWTHIRKDSGRTFYTSLGHIDDFRQPVFRRLLMNGIYWAAGLKPPDLLPRGADVKAVTASKSE